MVEGLGPSPEKKLFFFVLKMIILMQFLTGRSLGTRILQFNRKLMLTKTLQKLSKNSRSDQRGRLHHRHPLNMPLLSEILFFEYALISTHVLLTSRRAWVPNPDLHDLTATQSCAL